jgi:hypothetical protein
MPSRASDAPIALVFPRATDDDEGVRLLLATCVAALVVTGPVSAAATQSGALAAGPTAAAAMPPLYKNCTAFNKKYPHGVGKLKARDKSSGVPVTTFKRSTKIYNIAVGHNKGLDRDKDGVACEKA